MKIALSADGKELSHHFSSVFGRCSDFIIIESSNKKVLSSFSNEARNAAGGAGIQAAQTLIDHHVEAVIAPRLGPNAWDVFKSAGIQIFLGISGTLQDNVDAFVAGKLIEMANASESGIGKGRGRGRGRGRF